MLCMHSTQHTGLANMHASICAFHTRERTSACGDHIPDHSGAHRGVDGDLGLRTARAGRLDADVVCPSQLVEEVGRAVRGRAGQGRACVRLRKVMLEDRKK